MCNPSYTCIRIGIRDFLNQILPKLLDFHQNNVNLQADMQAPISWKILDRKILSSFSMFRSRRKHFSPALECRINFVVTQRVSPGQSFPQLVNLITHIRLPLTPGEAIFQELPRNTLKIDFGHSNYIQDNVCVQIP